MSELREILQGLMSLQFVVKVALTAVLIVCIEVVARRSTFVGAIIASLPLISVLAMIWLYAGTHDAAKVADLSRGVFWLVLPSLVLFITLPILLRQKVHFALALTLACIATIAAYFLMVWLLSRVGVKL